MNHPQTPAEPSVGGSAGQLHRHCPYVAGVPYPGVAAFPDGHDGPCDNPHPVLVLDLADESVRHLMRAYDEQGTGLRAMRDAVSSLLGEAVS